MYYAHNGLTQEAHVFCQTCVLHFEPVNILSGVIEVVNHKTIRSIWPYYVVQADYS